MRLLIIHNYKSKID